MKDTGYNSTGVRKNHKDFIANSVERFVGLEHQTRQKKQIIWPHQHVHRVQSKDLDDVFRKNKSLT